MLVLFSLTRKIYSMLPIWRSMVIRAARGWIQTNPGGDVWEAKEGCSRAWGFASFLMHQKFFFGEMHPSAGICLAVGMALVAKQENNVNCADFFGEGLRHRRRSLWMMNLCSFMQVFQHFLFAETTYAMGMLKLTPFMLQLEKKGVPMNWSADVDGDDFGSDGSCQR